jgi:hypothetical protein
MLCSLVLPLSAANALEPKIRAPAHIIDDTAVRAEIFVERFI